MKSETSNVKRQTCPAPGMLRVVRGEANPEGARGAQLFLFVGDPTVAPVQEIVPDEGVTLPPDRLGEHPFRLRVLHFNDLHGRISRITAYGIQPVLSRIVWRLHDLRRQYQDDPHSAVIVLSAGDDFASDTFEKSLDDDASSYQLYSAAGVDAGVLGNHDFDLGARRLSRAIRGGAQFPLLSANLLGGRWLDGLYYPAVLLVVKGVRIGIVGLTTRAEIKYRAGSEFHLADPVEAAHNLLPAVRPLCDVLILLSHLGHSLSSHAAAVRDSGDIELAESLLPGSVHLIVGGHTHHAMNKRGLSVDNVVNGIPVVQAGVGGRFLGEVDVTLRGRCCGAVTDARLTFTADLPIAEEFERGQVQPLVARMRSFLARSLGRVADHPDLSTDAVRNEFAAGESALANFITDGLVARCRAAGHTVDFSMIDRASVNYGLPVGGQLAQTGTIRLGDWFRLMPYADVVRICEISGHQLAALLEDNARRADRPDEPHVERGFLQFSRQVRYTLELGESRGAARVVEATVGDSPLEEQLEHTFLVACIGFVREQAALWEAQHPNLPLVDVRALPCRNTDMILRDEMIAYIREHGGVTEEGGAQRDGRLTFDSSHITNHRRKHANHS